MRQFDRNNFSMRTIELSLFFLARKKVNSVLDQKTRSENDEGSQNDHHGLGVFQFWLFFNFDEAKCRIEFKFFHFQSKSAFGLCYVCTQMIAMD